MVLVRRSRRQSTARLPECGLFRISRRSAKRPSSTTARFEGEYLVRDDGGYNPSQIPYRCAWAGGQIEHHYEAQSTRAFAKKAIDKFIADRKATQAPKKPKDYGKSNKVFTEDAAAKAGSF